MPEKKRVLITGATGNIGSVLCEYLITKHYNLIITARNKQSLIGLASDLGNNSSVSVVPITSDFSDPDSFLPIYQASEMGLMVWC